jgi:DHA1 family tetracycline resistance protein-like MFS transporter
LAGSGWVLNTIITSAITKAVEPDEIGGMLGISTSIESISRVISPTMGGFLFGSVGMWAPGVAGAAVLLWAVWLAYRQIISVKEAEPEVLLPAEESCA